MDVTKSPLIDDFGSADELFEHYALLVGDSGHDVETLVEQHAALAGFDSLEDYVAYLESAANQIPQITFSFSGTDVAEIMVEFTDTNGDMTVDAVSFELDLNKAVAQCLPSARWGGTLFVHQVFDVVQGLLPYLSDEHYARNPKLLTKRKNWTAENLYFDAAFKQVVGEHNSAEFAFEVTKWIRSSADLSFPEGTDPIAQMVEFSDQLLGNAAVLALDIMMGYLRNDSTVQLTSPEDLRMALLGLLDEVNMARVAIPMITGLYLSFLSVPMSADQAEKMAQDMTEEATKRAGGLTLVHSADTAVKH